MANEPPAGKKILVVDDDPVAVKVIEGRLTANGYQVATTTEAPQGLEMALKTFPDLIILDVMMPIVNGYNFCRLLKSETTHKKIPIILLTSRTDEKDIAIGQQVGADAYLPKPVNMEQLLNKIAKLVDGS